MLERDRLLLLDIVDAADELAETISAVSQADYLADKQTQRVAERLLEIIGEASTHVSDSTKIAIDANWRGAKDLRNIIIHGYRKILQNSLWNAATISVPEMAKAIRAFLDEAS